MILVLYQVSGLTVYQVELNCSAYIQFPYFVIIYSFYRILGKQLLFPKDEGFQHYQSRSSSSVYSKSLPSLSEINTSMKEYVVINLIDIYSLRYMIDILRLCLFGTPNVLINHNQPNRSSILVIHAQTAFLIMGKGTFKIDYTVVKFQKYCMG